MIHGFVLLLLATFGHVASRALALPLPDPFLRLGLLFLGLKPTGVSAALMTAQIAPVLPWWS